MNLTRTDVDQAARRLAGRIRRTPVLTSDDLNTSAGAQIFLKAENLQRTGSFKIRGATNSVAVLAERGVRHVVTYSSGNHAQALALAAADAGLECTVVMPDDAPVGKMGVTRASGAAVVTYDRYSQDRQLLADEVAAATGGTIVPPFDDALVVAGQGTAVAELLDEVGDLDVIVTPIGGGGLLAGSCLAAAPGTRMLGAEPAQRRAARDALATGTAVRVPVVRTICDGQQTERVGDLPLAVLLDHHAEVVGVTDEQVVGAMRFLLASCKVLVEPSGATAVAAVRSGAVAVEGRRVGLVLSGGNVDLARLATLMAEHP